MRRFINSTELIFIDKYGDVAFLSSTYPLLTVVSVELPLYAHNPYVAITHKLLWYFDAAKRDFSSNPLFQPLVGSAAWTLMTRLMSSSAPFSYDIHILAIYSRYRIWLFSHTIKSIAVIPAAFASHFDFNKPLEISLGSFSAVAYQLKRNAICHISGYEYDAPNYFVIIMPGFVEIIAAKVFIHRIQFVVYDRRTRIHYYGVALKNKWCTTTWYEYPAADKYHFTNTAVYAMSEDDRPRPIVGRRLEHQPFHCKYEYIIS